jgi:hypothetical protein
MGLVRLGVLEVMVGTSGPMAVVAVVISRELVMVMAVAVVVVVVSKQLDALHMHSPSSCGHCGKPVPLVSPALHAVAQVYHGY